MPDTAPSVLQVITSSHRRGAETFAIDLGRALAPRVRRLATVALSPAPPGAATLDVAVLAPRARSLGAVRALRAVARPADVVVAHGSATLPVTAAATALGGPPFVYRVIGDPRWWGATGSRRARVGVLLHRAAAVAVYVPSAADAVVALHGLPPDRVHVLPKGIDVAAWPVPGDDDRRAARLHLGLDDDRPVLAWMGALSAEKRPELAVALAGARPDVAVLVAGTGPMAADLAEAASRSRADVRFLGGVADVRPVLAAADVLVLTSRTEGVPGVVLEAQASGVPVVATAVGGVPDVVVDDVTGRLVGTDPSVAELAAAVTDVLARRAALGTAARAHVERHHALPAVADAWADLLAAVAAR